MYTVTKRTVLYVFSHTLYLPFRCVIVKVDVHVLSILC